MKPDPSQDPLSLFIPPVAHWFRQRFHTPTLAQSLGWPAIASGKNSLLIAPTGSGKTLAAFLACLDYLWRHPRPSHKHGVRVLYLSPLKALSVDIARNLEEPLAQIVETAHVLGIPLPPLTQATRTGDTPAALRRQVARRPPDLLITTPESLHLLLTSQPRAILRDVRYVIIDEIHAVCGNKRGVFLSLLLERLEALCPSSFTRIGLSATQRPLDEVARFLGGLRKVSGSGPTARYEARPVTIVDAGRRKDLDLEVSMPSGIVSLGGSVWPAIEERLYEQVRQNRSTIIFANNRRTTERLAAVLAARFRNERPAESEPAADAAFARPHHGSLSLESRWHTENALKTGQLRCVVATASLELGIDMGTVDLVCQVESAGGVARALQRVGRAGHDVGKVSRGCIYAKTPADLLESAALARTMLAADVEPLRAPALCLDVLAQQLVACVAVEPTDAVALYDLVRQAYPYRDLSAAAFESVLSMISGRFGLETYRDLRPRVSWDRIHNTLTALPGTAQRALVGGGTIPDTGRYPLHLGAHGPRLGELDEEFVLERRVGDTFRLGHATWRVESIEPQRIVVSAAAGESAVMPFWRGESAGRTPHLGKAVATLAREILERHDTQPESLNAWLHSECRLDANAAELLLQFLLRQRAAAGAVPDDRTLVVESFVDEAGETGLAVLSPFGSKINHALKIILQAIVRETWGIVPAALHADAGVLLRLPGTDTPPLDLLDGITPDDAARLLRDELPDSALFGLRFRQNAGRALLLPRPNPGKRTPLWLQRIRAKDLLQTVRKIPDFPIVIETYRECLDDDFDLTSIRALFRSLQAGTIRIHKHAGESPSPFVSSLLFEFSRKYLYEWDEPKNADRATPQIDSDMLAGLLKPEPDSGSPVLDPAAVARLDQQLRGSKHPPRTPAEMAEYLRRVGDLTPSELSGPMRGFLDVLRGDGRALQQTWPGTREPERWIHAEEAPLFETAFRPADHHAPERERGRAEAIAFLVKRMLQTRALVGLEQITERYPIDPADARAVLESIVNSDQAVRVEDQADGPRYADPRNLASARRLTLAARRKDIASVSPEVFADFVLRRSGLHHATQASGEAALPDILQQLEGYAAPIEQWETEILPARLANFQASWLNARLASGEWIALAVGARVAFLQPDFPSICAGDPPLAQNDSAVRAVQEFLVDRGACHVDEIATAIRLSPLAVRSALRVLLASGQVVADRIEPYRAAGDPSALALQAAAATRRGTLGIARRRTLNTLQERWRSAPVVVRSSEGPEHSEADRLAWCSILLDRYAVLCRETVALEPWGPRWSDLAETLIRAEMRGELRRGYFVEGLSGMQFATPETATALARHAAEASRAPDHSPPILLRATDPANLHGSNAPFDIPLLEGGTASLARLPSNALVLHNGRPTLIIEGHGKRLTGLASASDKELAAAIALLPNLATHARRIVKVETYNNAAALASPAAPWLEAAGFVRDHPGMTLYPRPGYEK